MPIPGDDITISDSAKVGLVEKSDKPYRSPEHIAELNRRRAQVPQKWYPIPTKRGWSDILKKGSWVKIVSNDAEVTIGQVWQESRLGYLLLQLYIDSVLMNGDLPVITECPLAISEDYPIVQAFTDDKEIADEAKNG